VEWIKTTLSLTDIQDSKFRLWGPDEEPAGHVMMTYLNNDFDGLEVEQFVRTLKRMNAHIPLRPNMITSVEQQFDRFGVKKGRLFTINADKIFFEYCELRHWRLQFAGETLECITQAEKARQTAAKSAAAQRQNNEPGDSATGRNGGQQRRPTGPAAPSASYKRPRS
jgi:hypothetical protein